MNNGIWNYIIPDAIIHHNPTNRPKSSIHMQTSDL